ncbi:MAG: N-acetylmuramoyl-L-alanine amidase family protein [Luteolibacter sp.]
MHRYLHLLMLIASLLAASTSWAASFKTVVIDAGHGGHDSGGQWGRVYEKHLALDTAVRLERHLKRMGFKTVMTRKSDYFVTLPRRVAIANSEKNAIFVSIHYNYTWKRHVSGLETFYHGQDSKMLANHVQGCLVKRTRTVDRRAKQARYFVIRNTKIPAILVEGGFVSNNEDRERMKSGDYRETIAKAIAEGIYRYRWGY